MFCSCGIRNGRRLESRAGRAGDARAVLKLRCTVLGIKSLCHVKLGLAALSRFVWFDRRVAFVKIVLSLALALRRLNGIGNLFSPRRPSLCLISLASSRPPPSRCRNFDGGFGCIPGAESHAGQIFTCVGALSIARSLHLVDEGERMTTTTMMMMTIMMMMMMMMIVGRVVFFEPVLSTEEHTKEE